MVDQSKFNIGEIIQHLKFGYRGVICEVDLNFAGSEQWYEQVARSRPPKDQPWYHVLVDGAAHTTYVAERHLEQDRCDIPVQHPLLAEHFDHFKDGRYGRVLH